MTSKGAEKSKMELKLKYLSIELILKYLTYDLMLT
jgi:hypothetical protein